MPRDLREVPNYPNLPRGYLEAERQGVYRPPGTFREAHMGGLDFAPVHEQIRQEPSFRLREPPWRLREPLPPLTDEELERLAIEYDKRYAERRARDAQRPFARKRAEKKLREKERQHNNRYWRAELQRRCRRRRSEERLQKVVNAPLWDGVDDTAVDHLPDVLSTLYGGDFPQRLRRLRAELADGRYRVEENRRILQEYRELFQAALRAVQKAEAEIADVEHRMEHPLPPLLPEQANELLRDINSLRGVLGVRVRKDGTIRLLVRTAMRFHGQLYDMGDFQLTLPTRLPRLGIQVGEGGVSRLLQIKLVRLPKTHYSTMFVGNRHNWRYTETEPRHYFHADDWPQACRVLRQPNGQYAVKGGWFCLGERESEIRTHLTSGELWEALCLLVLTMSDTGLQQNPNFWIRQGRLIPAEHEEAFMAGLPLPDLKEEKDA